MSRVKDHARCICHEPIGLLRRFWRTVARFAYRRYIIACTVEPCGVPQRRDPQSPCRSFEPLGERSGFACQGDGHCLCEECCHYCPETSEDDE